MLVTFTATPLFTFSLSFFDIYTSSEMQAIQNMAISPSIVFFLSKKEEHKDKLEKK